MDGLGGRRRPERPPGFPSGQDEPGPQPSGHHPHGLGGLGPIDWRAPYHRAEDLGDQLLTWHVSGGRTFWRSAAEQVVFPGDERLDGFQLLAFYNVPKGQVAFIKGVIAAPSFIEQVGGFAQTPADPPTLIPVPPDQNAAALAGAVPADPCCSFWQSPQAWQSGPTFDPQTGLPSGPPAATWRWFLLTAQGDFEHFRDGMGQQLGPAFIKDVPQPAPPFNAIPSKRGPGAQWDPNQQQRIGLVEARGGTHIMVRPDTVVMLFARWTQEATLVPFGARREQVIHTQTQAVGNQVFFPRPPGATGVQMNTVGSPMPVTVEQVDANQIVLTTTDVAMTGGDIPMIWLVPNAAGIFVTQGGPAVNVVAVWTADNFPGLLLGPSVGALHGFCQPSDRYPAKLSAVEGFNG